MSISKYINIKAFKILLLVTVFFNLNAQEVQSNSQLVKVENTDTDKEIQQSKINQLLSDTKNDINNEKAEKVIRYIADGMNWQMLYDSKDWDEVISLWINLHIKLKDLNTFITDFKIIGDKIKEPIQYTDFAKKTAHDLIKGNKEHYIDIFSEFVRASGKITNYDGILKSYLRGAPGTHAPNLIIKEKDKNTILQSSEFSKGNDSKTMILFYASGCGPCENLLEQLPKYYENITEKKVKIISISADNDEKVFKDKAKDFLWKDNYCDYQGFMGANFRNYGVAGTPTIFLLDNTGKILLKTAALEEVLGYINN